MWELDLAERQEGVGERPREHFVSSEAVLVPVDLVGVFRIFVVALLASSLYNDVHKDPFVVADLGHVDALDAAFHEGDRVAQLDEGDIFAGEGAWANDDPEYVAVEGVDHA